MCLALLSLSQPLSLQPSPPSSFYHFTPVSFFVSLIFSASSLLLSCVISCIFFPLSHLSCLSPTVLLIALSLLDSSLSLHCSLYHIHTYTQAALHECVLSSLLLSSHSFTPISISPLPLTHFYYCHRSLSLTLSLPLSLSLSLCL